MIRLAPVRMRPAPFNKRFQPTNPVVTPRAGHGSRQPASRLKPTLVRAGVIMCLPMLAFVVFAGSMSLSAECSLPSWPCYEVGSVVPVLFEYKGGVDGWDGYIRVTNFHGKQRLSISNGCFLAVSRGLGEFHPPTFARGDTITYWLRQTAPRGELVKPIGNGPHVAEYNVGFADPFRTIVDLSTYFDLSQPGVYTVTWGCRKWRSTLCRVEIMFEIVGAGSLAR